MTIETQIKREFTITTSDFNHRDVAALCFAAGQFESGILIEGKTTMVDAKSILGVLSLGLKPNDTFTVIAQGKDSKEAIDTIAQFIK